MKIRRWASGLAVLVWASSAGAITIEELRANVVPHRGQTLELTGRISGTIQSDRGRTFLMDLGRSGYVFVKDVPDNTTVRNDQRVMLVARVPKDATSASELEFVSAADAKHEPKPVLTTTVTVSDGRELVTSVSSAVIPVTSQPPRASPVNPPAAPLAPIDREVGRLKPHYANAIAHFNKRLSGGQRDQIAEVVLRFSMQNGLDPRLTVAVIAVESNFNPTAVSRSGAMGLGQLMPGTASGMGVSNAFDPIENVNAAVRLIRGHLEKYKDRKDSFNVALAAYYAGSGAVRRHGGVPPDKGTANYLWKVYNLYKQLAPEKFR